MKVRLLCVGKTQSKPIQILLNEYEKRIPSYLGFEIVEIPDLKNAKNLSIPEIQKLEWAALQKNITSSDTLILLDEKGKEMTSRQFANYFQKHLNHSTQQLIFIIGGAYGFSNEVQNICSEKLALSKMTFTHQMIRLFFTEQLYRAFSIIEGKPYHND